MKNKAGIAWYEEKDYVNLVALFSDGKKFPNSYDEWLDGAQAREHLLIESGDEIIRVVVEPTAFSAWCMSKALPPNAATRRRYVRHGALIGRPPKD